MDISSLRERDNINAFSVSELNNYIKNVFENNRTLSAVTVKGEISNFTNHRSGHLYFSLKDADGQIRAVMFRSSAARLKFMPESGMRVIVHGAVTVYPRDGSYQIYVSSMQPDGIGALYLAYEQLKERLFVEGLFDEEHKLQIPEYPSKIGVITSPTGAAVRDILNVTNRRYPLADIYLYPALVQGSGAEESLIKGIDYFDKSRLCDVIIIGRGGGSIEDLWAFNGERLARRIYSASIPIISAVGHETDFTICDFVSDLRAPTPSAAAEIAVPDIREIYMRLDSAEARCTAALNRSVERARDRLASQSLDRIYTLISDKISNVRDNIEQINNKCQKAILDNMKNHKNALALNAGKLDALSPLSVLTRGYAIASFKNGEIADISKLAVGDAVSVKLSGGVFEADVSRVIKEKQYAK